MSTPQSATHGTRSRYMRGCRCNFCRVANAAYVADWRHRTGRTDGGNIAAVGKHGLQRWRRVGCRCETCCAAAVAWRDRRIRAAAATC